MKNLSLPAALAGNSGQKERLKMIKQSGYK
jgi:hypothetical protein